MSEPLPMVKLTVSVKVAEVIINSLNRNPLGLPVMEAAPLINDLMVQVNGQVAAANEPKVGGEANTIGTPEVKSAQRKR